MFRRGQGKVYGQKNTKKSFGDAEFVSYGSIVARYELFVGGALTFSVDS